MPYRTDSRRSRIRRKMHSPGPFAAHFKYGRHSPNRKNTRKQARFRASLTVEVRSFGANWRTEMDSNTRYDIQTQRLARAITRSPLESQNGNQTISHSEINYLNYGSVESQAGARPYALCLSRHLAPPRPSSRKLPSLESTVATKASSKFWAMEDSATPSTPLL